MQAYEYQSLEFVGQAKREKNREGKSISSIVDYGVISCESLEGKRNTIN